MIIKTYLLLFFEFFKTGLFTFGGGYASLPFLYEMTQNYDWFTKDELLQLIAISGITPGPIGLNMATFSGYATLGIKGAAISSLALILPMIIIASQVFRLYRKFNTNPYVKSILYVLRPTSCALITSVGIKLVYELILVNSINWSAFSIVLILFILTFFLKRDPLIYILIAAVLGVIAYYLRY